MIDPLSFRRTAGSGPRAQEEEEGPEGPQVGGPVHQVASEGRLQGEWGLECEVWCSMWVYDSLYSLV